MKVTNRDGPAAVPEHRTQGAREVRRQRPQQVTGSRRPIEAAEDDQRDNRGAKKDPTGERAELEPECRAFVEHEREADRIPEHFLALGAVPVGNSPEAFTAFFNAESDKWYRVAKTAGVIGN